MEDNIDKHNISHEGYLKMIDMIGADWDRLIIYLAPHRELERIRKDFYHNSHDACYEFILEFFLQNDDFIFSDLLESCEKNEKRTLKRYLREIAVRHLKSK